MDDLFGVVFGLIVFGIIVYVVVIAVAVAVGVVMFTGALIVAPALALTVLILRAYSVDFRQAWFKFQQINFRYYAALLLPGVFFAHHAYETGEVHPFLVGCNLAIWVLSAGYLIWLGARQVVTWNHLRSLPSARRYVQPDGAVNVKAIASDDPTETLYDVPPDWQSENYGRRARQGSKAITGQAKRRAPSPPPTYPTKEVRDAQAATRAVREWGDLFEEAGSRKEERSYRQRIQSQ
ncbi:MAG: hypothetical protein AAF449_03345 [Myxococcota bacterium]